jgi:hypothetical protein
MRTALPRQRVRRQAFSACVRHGILWVVASVFGFAFGHAAMAQTNLVQNGSFAVTGGNTSFQFGTNNSYVSTETLANWSSVGYNFVFLPTSTVATGTYGNLSLYSATTSPSNSFNNASPTGGNFIGADGAYGTAAITQTINGLAVGSNYAVSFAWAAAQQTGFTGATTEQWQVTLGTSTHSTSVVGIGTNGFSGWMNQTFNFVATSSSEVLSFLANGTPAGVPPFALLANVSLTKVPEPASVTLMITGIAGLIGIARRRRSVQKSAAQAG